MVDIQKLVDRIVVKHATTTIPDTELHQEMDRKMIQDLDIYVRLRIIEIALDGVPSGEHSPGRYTKHMVKGMGDHPEILSALTSMKKAQEDFRKNLHVEKELKPETTSEKIDVPTGYVSSKNIDPEAFDTIVLKKQGPYNGDPISVAETVLKHLNSAKDIYDNYIDLAHDVNEHSGYEVFKMTGHRSFGRKTANLDLDFEEYHELVGGDAVDDSVISTDDPLIMINGDSEDRFQEHEIPEKIELALTNNRWEFDKVLLNGVDITGSLSSMYDLRHNLVKRLGYVKPMVIWNKIPGSDGPDPTIFEIDGAEDYIKTVLQYTVEFINRNKKRSMGEENWSNDELVVDPKDPVYGIKGILSDKNTGVYRSFLRGASSVTKKHTWLDPWDVVQSLTFGLSLGYVVTEKQERSQYDKLTKTQLEGRIKGLEDGDIPVNKSKEEVREIINSLKKHLEKYTEENGKRISELEKIINSSASVKDKEDAKKELERLKRKTIKIPFSYEKGLGEIAPRRSPVVETGMYLHKISGGKAENIRNLITGQNLGEDDSSWTVENIKNLLVNRAVKASRDLINRIEQRTRKWNNAGTGENTETDEENIDRASMQSSMFDKDTSNDSLAYKMGSDPDVFLPGNRVWSNQHIKTLIMAVTENIDTNRKGEGAYTKLVKMIEEMSHSDDYDFHGDQVEHIKTGETQPVYDFLVSKTSLSYDSVRDFLTNELPGKIRLLLGMVPDEVKDSNIFKEREKFRQKVKVLGDKVRKTKVRLDRIQKLLETPLKKIKEAKAQGKHYGRNIPKSTTDLIIEFKSKSNDLKEDLHTLKLLKEVVRVSDEMAGLSVHSDELAISLDDLIKEAKKEWAYIKKISDPISKIVYKGVPDLILDKNILEGGLSTYGLPGIGGGKRYKVSPGENSDKIKRLSGLAKQWESEYRNNHMSNVERIGILEQTREWRSNGGNEGDEIINGKFKFSDKNKTYELSGPSSLGSGFYPDLGNLDYLGGTPVNLGVPVGRLEPPVESYYDSVNKKEKDKSVRLTSRAKGALEIRNDDQKDFQRMEAVFNRKYKENISDVGMLIDDVFLVVLSRAEKSPSFRRDIENKFKVAEKRLDKSGKSSSEINNLFKNFASDINSVLKDIGIGGYSVKSVSSREQKFHLYMVWSSLEDTLGLVSETPGEYGIGDVNTMKSKLYGIRKSSRYLINVFDQSVKFGEYVLPGDWNTVECGRILKKSYSDFENNLFSIHHIEDTALYRRRNILGLDANETVPDFVHTNTEFEKYRDNMMTHDEFDKYTMLKQNNAMIINLQRNVMKLSPPGEYVAEKEKLGMGKDNKYSPLSFSRSNGYPVEAIFLGEEGVNSDLTRDQIDEVLDMMGKFSTPGESGSYSAKTASVMGVVSRYLEIN